MKPLHLIVAACLGLPCRANATAGGDVPHAVIVHQDDLVWQDAAGLPAGSKMALLFGDPAADGPIVIRVRIPADSTIAPHFHPRDEWVTVLDGAARMGMGDTFDLSLTDDFAAGDMHFLPARHTHFVKTTTEVTVEIHTTGPWGITFVDPSDDPRR